MNGKEVVLTREELYQQVWETPMRKLAPRYGLSDVGLAKTCVKHQIPRPPLGHWAKVSNGKPSPQPKLPKLSNPQLATLRLKLFDDPVINDEVKPPTPVIKLSPKSSKLHPLVQSTGETLRQIAQSNKGLLIIPKGYCLDLTVTLGSLERSLRILSALFLHWESIGGSVAAGHPDTLFRLERDEVSISLKENLKRIPKPGTRGYWQRDVTLEPSDKLTLRIHGATGELRSTWNDRIKQRLENILGQVVVNMQRCLTRKRTIRLDEECIARQESQLKAIRNRRQQIESKEMERREKLIQRVNEWKKASLIREYLTLLDCRVQDRQLNPEDPEFYEQWLVWAHWYADQLCPLTKTTCSSPLQENLSCQNTAISELDVTAATRSWLDHLSIEDTDGLLRHMSETLSSSERKTDQKEHVEIARVLEGLGYSLKT